MSCLQRFVQPQRLALPPGNLRQETLEAANLPGGHMLSVRSMFSLNRGVDYRPVSRIRHSIN